MKKPHWSGATRRQHWEAVIAAGGVTFFVLAWWKGWVTFKL